MKLEGFRGIISAIITPNGAQDSAVDSYLRFLHEKGIGGVFILGTTGEGAKLSVAERSRIAEKIVNSAGDRFLKIVHVGSSDVESSSKLARHSQEIGADAVSAVAPYYYRYEADSLANFYSAIASSTSIPVLFYNNPGRQAYSLSFQDIARVFELVPAVKGIKDSSGDPDLILELHSSFGSSHFVACGGDNLLYYAFSIGVRAHVSALSSIYPELAVGIFRAVERGDRSEALRLQLAVNRVRRVLKSIGPDLASYRYALALRGVDLGPPIQPTRNLRQEEKELLSRALTPINKLAEDVGRLG
ncbi:MAG: dihydrodipicolinate synthase family protein [Nitrososphaerota archaeon]